MIIEVYGQLKFQYKLIYRVRTPHFSKSLLSRLSKKKKFFIVTCENSGKTTTFHVDHGSPSRRLLHGLINKNYQTDHIPQKFLKKLLYDLVVYLLLF